MKKSLIALAVAGAMTVPMLAQADATVYGQAQFRLTDADNTDLDAQMSTTRLGVKGTVDNDIEGLTTGFQIEWDFSADTAVGTTSTSSDDVSVRKSLVFLKGDWGQTTFGRQNNPAEVQDLGFAGKHGGSFSLTEDRIGNAISYATLPRNGIEFAAGVVMDAGDAGADDADATALALTYTGNGITAALAQYDVKDSYDVTGIKLVYAMNDFTVGANYQEKDFDASGTDDIEVFTVGGTYTMGMTKLYAEYQDIDEDNGTANDNDATIIGASYSLGASASVGVEYADFDNDTGTNANNDALTFEYNINFQFSDLKLQKIIEGCPSYLH